jgi:hypothetical protein
MTKERYFIAWAMTALTLTVSLLLFPFTQVYGEEKGGDAVLNLDVDSNADITFEDSDVEIGDILFSMHPHNTIEFWDNNSEVFRIKWTSEKVEVVYAEDVKPTEAARLFFKILNEMYPGLIVDACKKRPECGCATGPLAPSAQDDQDDHDEVGLDE